jgi:hypothetical protein
MATSHLAMMLDEFEVRIPSDIRQPVPMILDSSSAIAMGNSFKDTKHTRHIMRRYHFVREGVANKKFALSWIKTDLQLADIATKQTPGPRHSLLTNLLLVNLKKSSAQEG